MPLEGLTNPRLKGACTREEFKREYISYIILLHKEVKITRDKRFLVDDRVDRDGIISHLYEKYLEAYKYDEDDYNKWLERKD